MMDYDLTVKGQLDLSYAAWFGDLVIRYEDGNTVLTAVNSDQATLYGIILRCRDLGLTLLALNPTKTGNK
ncbi:MAG: hypothetical protein R3C62_17745 [Chloroflexota bacterium]